MKFDLKTGQATILCKPGEFAKPVELWKAVLESGFTPVKIEARGKTYTGPEK